MQDRSGETLDGRYHLEKLLGEGGMGQVYLGTHVITNRKVAVKFLHDAFANNQEIVGRFYREARAATAVGSKHICQVLDMKPIGQGQPFLVLEYMEGESLRELLEAQGWLSPAATIEVLLQMLEGLAAAHDVGIVHRDIKPENIFLIQQPKKEPLVKILDFGISRYHAESEDEGLTVAGAILGSPNYMSPEQAMGEIELGPEADIYAVGVILYEILTGQVPFDAPTFEELAKKLVFETPPHPCDTNPSVPRPLADIALKAMARDPRARYPSARDMRAALVNLQLLGVNLSGGAPQANAPDRAAIGHFPISSPEDYGDDEGDDAPTEIAPVLFDPSMAQHGDHHPQHHPQHPSSGAGAAPQPVQELGLLSEEWSPPVVAQLQRPSVSAPALKAEPSAGSKKILFLILGVIMLLALAVGAVELALTLTSCAEPWPGGAEAGGGLEP
jgi:serine/threonine-protein kinase